ncbi:hypothetical protein V7266_28040, partial [Neobacillus drentensis]|uniref:hypothetical protein n=1 Tax=Neobacillus drentensis TaxID=220684 RepID=UPI002FFFBB58
SKDSKEKEKKKDEGSGQSPKEYIAETISDSENSEKQFESVATIGIDSNHKMVWSKPVKTESTATIKEAKVENSSKDKKQRDEHDGQKDYKKDNSKGSKSQESKSQKEAEKSYNQTSTSTSSKQEKKQENTQEAVAASIPVISQDVAPKKVETTTNEKVVNDTNNVWKQKDQETRAFRFTGEPISKNQERSFPFAGWPRKNSRTFHF